MIRLFGGRRFGRNWLGLSFAPFGGYSRRPRRVTVVVKRRRGWMGPGLLALSAFSVLVYYWYVTVPVALALTAMYLYLSRSVVPVLGAGTTDLEKEHDRPLPGGSPTASLSRSRSS